ncbi:MAG: hypothetical protein ABW187_02745 [Dokdonella sp.]
MSNRSRVRFWVGTVLLPALLAACAVSRTGPTPTRFVDTGVQNAPALAKRQDNEPVRTFDPAQPIQVEPPRIEFIQPKPDPGNGLPAYPSSLLARPVPPTVVKVRLRVESDGAVFKVDPLDPSATADQRAFIEAVRDACWSWKYSPLIRMDLNRGETVRIEGNGLSTEFKGHPTALPFHVDYAFTFSRRDGRPSVETEMIASASDAFDGAPGAGRNGG